MPVVSQPVPNLIQGVSQQSPLQRRDTQCEAQFDCWNSPVYGAVARPPVEHLAKLSGADLSGAYFYEIVRGASEHYLVVIRAGDLKVYDLQNGSPCSVTFTAPKTYLGVTGDPRDQFVCQTVNDYTFVGNKSKTVAMEDTTKEGRPKEALVYFRGGNYSMTLQLSITLEDRVYVWLYTTPDNSVAANSPYIQTNQLAATFYRALSGALAPVTTSGDLVASSKPGVGSVSQGDASVGAVVAPISAASLGFSLEINGNVIRIWRSDGVEFQVDTADGQGDTCLKAFKDHAQSFADLPAKAFNGFALRVSGESRTASDDFYVEYTSVSASDGHWQETLAPGAHTTIDAATMPHTLINTGAGTFEWTRPAWGDRVVGDEDSSKDPSFIGFPIQDLFYHQSRLGIMTEGTVVWSKARNPFVWFRDTVQTVLATDPVDQDVAAADYIPLLRRTVSIDESLFLWAQLQQLRVSSGQDPFKQDTVQVLPSTAYEFAERPKPLRIGKRLFFASELGGYSAIIALPFANGQPQGDGSDITGHVPTYIPEGVHTIIGSPTLNAIFVAASGAPAELHLYNYLNDADQVLQSAWNKWRIPCAAILWASIYRSTLYLLLQRGDGAMFATVNLQPNYNDPTGDYLTRLDLRVSEAQCSFTFDAGTGNSTITLPFAVPEAADHVDRFIVATSADGPAYTRGREFKVLSVSGSTVVVRGDLTDYQWYAGLRITAEREESEFYLRTPDGPVPADEIGVRNYRATFARTGYTRAEATYAGGEVKREEWFGRTVGLAYSELGTPQLGAGKLTLGVDSKNTDCTVRLINDTFLPSAWQTVAWHYEGVLRAPVPRAAGRAA